MNWLIDWWAEGARIFKASRTFQGTCGFAAGGWRHVSLKRGRALELKWGSGQRCAGVAVRAASSAGSTVPLSSRVKNRITHLNCGFFAVKNRELNCNSRKRRLQFHARRQRKDGRTDGRWTETETNRDRWEVGCVCAFHIETSACFSPLC